MFLPEVSEIIINVSVDLIEYCTIGIAVFFFAVVVGALSGFGQ